MKRAVILILLFFAILQVSGQNSLDTDGLNNIDNIYLFSLKEYAKTLDSVKTNTIYVKKVPFIGENWPQSISAFKIIYLYAYDDYKTAIKANGGSIEVLGIGELNYQNGKFFIGIIPFHTTIRKKTVNFANSGGLHILFDYDCSQNKFSYIGIKEYGF